MPEPAKRMLVHELLEDTEEDTKSRSISGTRHKSCESQRLEELIMHTCTQLKKLPNGIARVLEENLLKCLDEFKAWDLCAPTDEVRWKVWRNYASYELQARSVLRRDR